MAEGPEHSGREHLPHEKREWVAQRVAWVLMGLVLMAALAGVFGKGPVSRRVARSPGGAVELRYERMVRFQDQVTLRLKVEPSGVDEEGLVAVTVGGDYLGQIELKSVVPEPEQQLSGGGVVLLKFRPLRAGEPVVVQLRGKVEQLGTLRGTVEASKGGVPDVLRFEQFAYP